MTFLFLSGDSGEEDGKSGRQYVVTKLLPLTDSRPLCAPLTLIPPGGRHHFTPCGIVDIQILYYMNTYSNSSRGRFARSSRFFSCVGAAVLLGAVSSLARADVVYNENVMGDFSGSGLAPTSVTLHAGSNEIIGRTGRAARGAPVDRDYFKVTVPSGFTLSSIIELPDTTVGGDIGFLGIQAGPQLTLPTNPPGGSAAGLLGYAHIVPTATPVDLIPFLSIPFNGSSGFTTLGEGTYSFWAQDFNEGSFTYHYDLRLTSVTSSAVPEPSTYGLMGAAAVLLLALHRRFKKSA